MPPSLPPAEHNTRCVMDGGGQWNMHGEGQERALHAGAALAASVQTFTLFARTLGGGAGVGRRV